MQRDLPLHLIIALILCYCSPVVAETSYSEITAESFTINSSKKFYIHVDDNIIGTVHRKSHSKSYEFIDSDRDLLSVAILDLKNPNLGTKFVISNAEGGNLGSIVESPFAFLPEFYILSPDGITLAIASANFLHTEYILLNPETGNIFAKLYRPAFRDSPDWSANILIPDEFDLDPCVFISFIAIRSDS